MGVLLKTALLLTLVGVAFGALQRGVADTHPNYPGQCWDSVGRRAYAVDQSWPARGQCAEYSCYAEGGEMYYTLASCGSVAPGPGCSLVTTNTGNYPDCCPSLSC